MSTTAEEVKASDFMSDLIGHYAAIRGLIAKYYTFTVAREQALIRLAESEMWLTNAPMKVEGPHAKPTIRQSTG